jgi:lipopolysaccharide export system permease protein
VRILSRYLLREFLKFFFAALAGFVVIFYIVDLLDNMSNLVRYQAPLGAAFLLYLFKLPQIVFYVMPVAVLVATLFSLTILSKDNEVMALRSSGISVHRFVAPLILLSILLSGFAFVNNEFLVPVGNARGDQIYKINIKHEYSDVFFKRDKFWYRSKNAIYNIQSFDYLRKTLGRITIYRIGPNFRPVGRVDALKAQWIDGKWHFYNVVVRDFLPDGSARVRTARDLIIDIPETPESFKVIAPDPDHFSFTELKRYITKIRRDGYDATKYLVDLNAKLSTPFISFLSCLIAIPFALRTTRAGQRPLGVLMAIVLASAYWFVLAYSLAFGHKGTLSPLLAAWIPNVFFASLGGLFLVNVEQ